MELLEKMIIRPVKPEDAPLFTALKC